MSSPPSPSTGARGRLSSPPRLARALLAMVLPRALRADAIAELDEKFAEYCREGRSRRWARRWYRRQVLGSLHPRLWRHAPPPLPEKGNKPVSTDWARDVRFGLRMLAKTPGMTAVIVVTLALGIGFNGAVFSLANTILLNDIPVDEADRLAFVQSTNLAQGLDDMRVSVPDYLDFEAARASFESLAAWQRISINLSDGADTPQRVVGAWVTPSIFDVLRVEPYRGRRLGEEDARPGAADVALLGYGLWQSRYGGNEQLVGEVIRVNGAPYEVVGILPPTLEATPFAPEVWTPLIFTQERRERRDRRQLAVVGRLAPGAGHGDVDAQLKLVAARIEAESPVENRGVSVAVKTFGAAFTEDANRVITLILLGAVGVLLLLTCANVANLLISRSLERAAEVGIRTALGASRWRVVRQMMVESLLLSAFGGLAAVVLTVVGARGLEAAIMVAQPPVYWDFSVHPRVYLFVAALAVSTSLIFGLAPALHATRGHLAHALKDGSRGSSGGTRRLTGALVVAQLVFAVVLLTSAGLMIRSTRNVESVDWAIDPDNVLTMGLALPPADYPEREHIVAFHDQLSERLGALPMVESHALALTFPGRGGFTVSAELESLPVAEGNAAQLLQQVIVGTEYFEMAETRPLRGRLFSDADRYASDPVIVVEQRLAERYWPGEDPIGKRLRWVDEEELRWQTVVGVVPDIKQTISLEFTGDYPVVYTPYRQEPLRGMGLLVRSSADVETLAATLRREVQRLDPDLPLYSVATLNRVIGQRVAGFRIASGLFALLGAVALFLSCIGIYAVMAFSVGRRRREIGIRVALGAQPRQVLGLVLQRAIGQTAVGVMIGIVAALAASQALAFFMYEVSPRDPLTFGGTVLVLVLTALIACIVPGRRASRVDPLEALRSE